MFCFGLSCFVLFCFVLFCFVLFVLFLTANIRTGSGKSSLLIALFRFVDIAWGSIRIDGVDVANISLKKLRSALAIVPQEPCLFSGSLRDNLDPLSACTDNEISNVLDQVGFPVENLDEPLVQLSHGERNIVAVARVLLRKTKMMIEDEATAAVSTRQDQLIQNVLRKLKITRLVIAHRINTIVDCDQVMVMDAGCVDEMGSPSVLLSNDGSFRSLVLDTGAASSKKLFSLASTAQVVIEESNDIETDFAILSVKI